jgi:hypothetical protein
MRCPKNLILKAFFLCLILFLFSTKIYAQGKHSGSEDVEAVVDLSVCGDNVAEGNEDCDKSDLNNKTCGSLGYQSGDLSCDISCEFDIASCSGTLSTTTPTSTPTSTIPSQVSSSGSSGSQTSEPIPSQQETSLITGLLRQIDSKLSLVQSRFDEDLSGKLEIHELYDIVKTWVDDWKIQIQVSTAYSKGELSENTDAKPEKCDLDDNGICNVIDLSILLYYIER